MHRAVLTESFYLKYYKIFHTKTKVDFLKKTSIFNLQQSLMNIVALKNAVKICKIERIRPKSFNLILENFFQLNENNI